MSLTFCSRLVEVINLPSATNYLPPQLTKIHNMFRRGGGGCRINTTRQFHIHYQLWNRRYFIQYCRVKVLNKTHLRKTKDIEKLYTIRYYYSSDFTHRTNQVCALTFIKFTICVI